MLEAEAVVATSFEHPIRSLKPELGIGTRRVVWGDVFKRKLIMAQMLHLGNSHKKLAQSAFQ